MITPVGLADRRSSLVRRTVIDSVLIVAFAVTATLVALVVFVGHADIVVSAGFAVTGLLVGLRGLFSVISYIYGDGEADPQGARRRRRDPAPEAPADLFEIEGRVTLSMVSEFDHQSRLRPLIREIAAQRLAANRHIDLVRQPDAARARLGERLWQEINAPPVRGDPRDAPGPTLAALRRLVDDLEAI